MKFGEKIRELRNRNGWSQEELAKKLNVNPRTVSTYENGTYPRYQNTYEKLAEIFDVPVQDFLQVVTLQEGDKVTVEYLEGTPVCTVLNIAS